MRSVFHRSCPGWLALVEGDYAEADDLFCQGATLCEQKNIKEIFCWAQSSRGFSLYRLGKPFEAKMVFKTAIKSAKKIDSFVGLVISAIFSLPLIADLGKSELAIELYAALRNYPIITNSVFFDDLIGGAVEAMAGGLDAGLAVQVTARGQELDLDGVIDVVLETLDCC